MSDSCDKKKHEECNASIVLRSTKVPYLLNSPTKQKVATISFTLAKDDKKNVPLTIVDPLVNTSSTEITVIVYSFLKILRPSRKPFF